MRVGSGEPDMIWRVEQHHSARWPFPRRIFNAFELFTGRQNEGIHVFLQVLHCIAFCGFGKGEHSANQIANLMNGVSHVGDFVDVAVGDLAESLAPLSNRNGGVNGMCHENPSYGLAEMAPRIEARLESG